MRVIILIFSFVCLLFVGCSRKNVLDDADVVRELQELEEEMNRIRNEKPIDLDKDETKPKEEDPSIDLAPLDTPEPSIRDKKFDANLVLKPIYFEFDSADISKEARDILEENADWCKKNLGYQVLVEGHTDERGTTEYNLALGQRRASNVRAYLAYLGIEAKRVSTLSYGEEKPSNFDANEEAWQKNRRVAFKVTKLIKN